MTTSPQNSPSPPAFSDPNGAIAAQPVPRSEQETTINITPVDEVMIWSNIPKHVRALRKRPKVREVASGFHGSTEWADFRVSEKDFNPAQAVKRQVSAAQRERLTKQLAANKGGK